MTNHIFTKLFFAHILFIGSIQYSIGQDLNAPRPIPKHSSVFIEELTWMEVRDFIKDGKTTVIVATGGIEQNGPFVATGKHNYVLQPRLKEEFLRFMQE